MNDKMLLSLFEAFNKSDAVEMKYSENGTVFEVRKKEAFVGAGLAGSSGLVESAGGVGGLAGSLASSGLAGTPAVSVSSSALPETSVAAPHAPCDTDATAGCEVIKSPIVGTFYRAASPDAPPFVEVGTKVKKGQKICILEAMKMMNALEAEFDCVIQKILVTNGELAEFDQPLFEVSKT